MRKRILSLVLAIAMCFSVVSVVVTANEDMILMETFGELVDQYREQVWDWQMYQFDAMTDEQFVEWEEYVPGDNSGIINDAWASYETNKDEIRGLAEKLAEEFITDTMLSNETMKDLYKWKVMRDIANGVLDENGEPVFDGGKYALDATSDNADYQLWLERFVDFEALNDEQVTPSAPGAALNDLNKYSGRLTEYFGELVRLNVAFEGEDEDVTKVNAYLTAFDPNGDGNDEDDDMESIMSYLEEDVKELMVDGMVNAFDLGMRFVTNKINRTNTNGLLDELPDRDMKGLFLIWGEDFTRDVVEFVSNVNDDLVGMDKTDLIQKMLGPDYGANVPELLEASNEKATDAMYATMKAVAKYVAEQEFCDEIIAEIDEVFAIDAIAAIDTIINQLEEAMNKIANGGDGEHGLELVHFNTYMGRELLRYDLEGELVRLKDAVIEFEGAGVIDLGYAHDRFPFIEDNLNNSRLAQFDVESFGEDVKVKAHDDEIGQLEVLVEEGVNGTADVKVYRGYSDADVDGIDDYAEDAYRYVTSFKVEVKSYYVNLEDVQDPSVDEDGNADVVIKGETNLDEVKVTVKDENGDVVYEETHTKEELEEGIEIELEGVEPGDDFTVEVTKPGDDEVLAEDDFTVEGEDPYVDLEDVQDPVVKDDGTADVEIKGETNLDEVKVTVKDENGDVVYEETHTKEELEEGIEIELEGVEIGDDFTVEVTKPDEDDVLAEDDFTVVDGYYVDLEEVRDTTVDGTITVKGETNLDYVTVAVIKNGETIYAVVYSKAEFEAGITLNAPDNAQIGEVYTVVVGTELASASDEFAIEGAESEYYVELEDVRDTTVDGTITVVGETNLDYVTVAVIKNGVTIYAVVYSKAEFEAGITLNAPDNAHVGEVYTVVVGTELASDSDEFAITGEEGPYVDLEDVQNPVVKEDGNADVVIKGETNLDEVKVTIKDENGEVVYEGTHTKEELEEGIEIELEGVEIGDNFTVEVTKPGEDDVLAEDDFTVVDGYYVVLEDVLDTTVDGTITIKGMTNLEYVTVSIVKNGKTIYAVVYSEEEFEAGITLNTPADAVIGEVYTVVVGTEEASDDDDFTVIGDYVILDEIEDPSVDDGKLVIKGETNLDEVDVVIKDKDGNVIYDETHTKEELENGIEIKLPDDIEIGDDFTIEVTKPGEDEVLDSDTVTVTGVKGKLSLAGSTTRPASVGGTVTITTTPQNIYPEGAEVKVVWTAEDGTIIEITNLSGDSNNIATIKKLKKGTTTVTATLYVNGIAVDSKTVTIKDKSSNSSSSSSSSDKSYTSITVKVDETKDVVKVPTGGVNAEFTGTGDGKVEITIEDGIIKVTGVTEGTVKGQIVIKNEAGKIIATLYYEFIVTDDDTKPGDHECEWPDIAAGWEGKADAHWAHLTIDIMTINGYIKGYPDGLFKPDQNITRAEFSAIVYRILGLEDSEDGVYYDDTKGHWAEELIATMSLPEGYGMTRGYGDGNFGPNDFITREQAVAIIARAKSAVWVEAEEGAKNIFTDSEDISWWFDGEMDAAVTNGLITGYEDGSYRPLGFTTRAEACTLLARAWPEVLELN